jgi:glycosyltransferase involved in cell wall biosynthesis
MEQQGNDKVFSVMKVHFHTDSPFVGGSENMLLLLLNSVKVRNYCQPSLSYRYSRRYEEGLQSKLETPVDIFRIRAIDPMRFVYYSSLNDVFAYRLILSVIRKLIFYPTFIFQCIKLFFLFLRIKPDILHINSGGYPAALSTRAAALAGRIAGVKNIIYVANNLAVPYDSIQRYMEYPIDFLVQKSVKLFVTGSSIALQELKRVLNRSKSIFKVINNGSSVSERFQHPVSHPSEFKNDSRVIVAVIAILEPRKGHQVLLESIYLLSSSNKIDGENFLLVIEGEGDLSEEIEQNIARMKISHLVKMVGKVENIYDFIVKSDIVILPSLYQEDFPNVILEAMALSKPVIATRVGGIPEQVVDGITGYLVAPNNPLGLAESILSLLNNHELRVQMGVNGYRRFIDNFTAERAIERYLEEYDWLLKSQDAI